MSKRLWLILCSSLLAVLLGACGTGNPRSTAKSAKSEQLSAPQIDTVKAMASTSKRSRRLAFPVGGTVWTFVSATPAGNETEIQGTATETLDQLVSDLNTSADAEVSKCTWSASPILLLTCAA